MYFKSYAFALLAIWLFNGCLAAPKPEPKAEPCGGSACASPCTIERCHTIPITSHIPIRTTHRLIPSSNCGYGWGSSGWGNGGWGSNCGYGSWGLGRYLGNWGWGNGCGNGWGYCGLDGGWGYGGLKGWGWGGCWC